VSFVSIPDEDRADWFYGAFFFFVFCPITVVVGLAIRNKAFDAVNLMSAQAVFQVRNWGAGPMHAAPMEGVDAQGSDPARLMASMCLRASLFPILCQLEETPWSGKRWMLAWKCLSGQEPSGVDRK
jgi:hypothetical protein